MQMSLKKKIQRTEKWKVFFFVEQRKGLDRQGGEEVGDSDFPVGYFHSGWESWVNH